MAYNNKSVGPLKISEASYNKQNRKMRKENPTMGSKLTSGTSPRRVSFACRFGNMQGDMKDKNGTPSKLAKALKNGVLVAKKLLETFVENIKNHNMGANMKHYTKDGEYKGKTHKMNGKIHTGAEHSETSKIVSHNKKGPFKMKTPLYKAGMWANIHAKKKRGDTSTDDRPSKKEWDKNTK